MKTEGSVNSTFERYAERRARGAAERTARIDRERGKLARTYLALGLKVPADLLAEPSRSPTTAAHGGRRPSAARAAARAAGLRTFWGSRCGKAGHPGERYTRTGNCVACAKMAQAAAKAREKGLNHADRGQRRPVQAAQKRRKRRAGQDHPGRPGGTRQRAFVEFR